MPEKDKRPTDAQLIAVLQNELVELRNRLQAYRTWPDLDRMQRELDADAALKAKACPHCGKDLPRE